MENSTRCANILHYSGRRCVRKTSSSDENYCYQHLGEKTVDFALALLKSDPSSVDWDYIDQTIGNLIKHKRWNTGLKYFLDELFHADIPIQYFQDIIDSVKNNLESVRGLRGLYRKYIHSLEPSELTYYADI